MATAKKTAAKAAKPSAKADATASGADNSGDQGTNGGAIDDQAERAGSSASDGGTISDAAGDQLGDISASSGPSEALDLAKVPLQTLVSTAMGATAVASGNAVAGEADGMRLYRVVSYLQHDQVTYAPGADVHLTDKQAQPLLGHTVQLPGDDDNTDETAG